VTRFSTTRTTPSGVLTPIAVDPSCTQDVKLVDQAELGKRAAQIGSDLDSFYGVFNLKQSAFRTESVDSSIVFASCQKHVETDYGSS